MDVIAGRKTQGEITGDILVNGHPKDQKTWSRVVGYVEQMDIHSPQVCSCQGLPKSQHLLSGSAKVMPPPARVCQSHATSCQGLPESPHLLPGSAKLTAAAHIYTANLLQLL